MLIFRDRRDAGKLLSEKLLQYKEMKDAIIIGLPRGGVVTADEIAKALKIPIDIICPRKIGAPYNPEFAIGAITETGEGKFNEDVVYRLGVSQTFIDEEVEKEKAQAQRRLDLYRKDRPKRNLENKIVILVDDGLATGSTMKAAIVTARAEGAAKIIVAIPVSPIDTLHEMRELVDEVVCLSTPADFYAIGQFYENFSQTEDQEVIDIMSQEKWKEHSQ